MVRERQAQLLDDDKPCWLGPVCRCTCVCVYTQTPLFISVHGSMIVLSGLSLIPELPSLLLDSLLGQQASQPPSQPLSRTRACPVAEASLLPRRPPGPATTSDELSFRSWCVQHVRLSVSAAV